MGKEAGRGSPSGYNSPPTRGRSPPTRGGPLPTRYSPPPTWGKASPTRGGPPPTRYSPSPTWGEASPTRGDPPPTRYSPPPIRDGPPPTRGGGSDIGCSHHSTGLQELLRIHVDHQVVRRILRQYLFHELMQPAAVELHSGLPAFRAPCRRYGHAVMISKWLRVAPATALQGILPSKVARRPPFRSARPSK